MSLLHLHVDVLYIDWMFADLKEYAASDIVLGLLMASAESCMT